MSLKRQCCHHVPETDSKPVVIGYMMLLMMKSRKSQLCKVNTSVLNTVSLSTDRMEWLFSWVP